MTKSHSQIRSDPKSNDTAENVFWIQPPAEHYIMQPVFSEYLLLFDKPDFTLSSEFVSEQKLFV